jgi:hypothetical protein
MDTPMGSTGYGASTGSDVGSSPSTTGTSTTNNCPHCGKSLPSGFGTNKGLEQFLGRLGISEEMVNNLRSSMQNIDVDEYLNTAREYLKSGSEKATTYAKEHPGKVAAGVAVLAVGAGLLISALNKD